MEAKTKTQILDSLVWIPKQGLSKKAYSAISRDLYLKPRARADMGFGEPLPVNLLKERNGHIGIPREYGKRWIDSGVMQDLRSNGTDRKFSFKGELRPHQKILVGNFLAGISKGFNGGILQATCGSGKTVMGLNIIKEIGGTALVIVHKEFLMNQWKEQVEKFLPGCRVGFVQQDKCDFRDKDIVIGMIHSLVKRSYDPELYKYFRIVVIDEVHHLSAPTFSKVIEKFPSKFRCGLSATPKRSDGMENVFFWHIGEVVAKSDFRALTPKVYMKRVPFDINMAFTGNRRGKVLLARVINRITSHSKRNNWIVNQLIKALQAGRKVLLLSDRLKHLRVLKELLAGQFKSDFKPSVGFYIGGMHADQRKASEKCDLILGTFSMAKEGLDIADLDTLILASPKTDVEQQTGRILRHHPGKKDPIVLDIVDSIGIARAFASKRFKKYKQLGYDVSWT